jgi:UDP-3-O-[3-hydroxymyristoyl] glucosamine N-acyltransferase
VHQRIFEPSGPYSLGEICRKSGATLLEAGDSLKVVADVASLKEATGAHLSFLENRKYYTDFRVTAAKAVIVHPSQKGDAPKGTILLLSSNPHKSFALAAQMFHPLEKPLNPGVSESAWLHANCSIGLGTEIEMGAKIFDGVSIGENCFVGANTVIGSKVILGDRCHLSSNVTITHCHMGRGVTIHSGARVGQTGFGFAMERSGHTWVPQIGMVLIGDNVRIGANTTIDRGALDDTIIGDGCMIDNLVQIAHNVRLGRNCVVAAQSGVAGSSVLGDFVVIGGQSAVSGHLLLGDEITIAGKSGVSHNLPRSGIYGGIPSVPIQQWRRQVGMIANMVKRHLRKD